VLHKCLTHRCPHRLPWGSSVKKPPSRD